MVVDSATVASWPRGELLVADATVCDASSRRKALLDQSGSPFTQFSVLMGTEAAKILYSHLRPAATSDKNLAEHQSIAWALAERPEAILVSRDKGATLLALAELGRGNAAHPSELWLYLLGEGRITKDQFKDLCRRTSNSEQSPVPLRCQRR